MISIHQKGTDFLSLLIKPDSQVFDYEQNEFIQLYEYLNMNEFQVWHINGLAYWQIGLTSLKSTLKMLISRIKPAFRTILRYRSFSILNIAGLTLGFASCLIIFLIVEYQLGYDRFNTKADRIYRVTKGMDFNANTSFAVAPALRNSFPDLETVSQVFYQEKGLITIQNAKFNEKGYAFADQYLPLIFDYSWVEGNSRTALADPNSIVLTETLARKYFGAGEAMGKIINLDNKHDLKVTGVIKDLPGNTHLPFNFLVSFETVRPELQSMGAMSNYYWINGGSFSYLLTRPDYMITALQKQMPAFIEKTWGKDIAKGTNLVLQPLGDIVFDTRYINNLRTPVSKETYYSLIAIGVLILLVACINFINLSTAQAINRAKEIGVRKVLGSNRAQLIRQFLGETALIVLISLIVSIIMVAVILPALSIALDIKMDVNQLLRNTTVTGIVLVAGSVVFLAGLYPAFIQSAFNPVRSLKTKAVMNGNKLTVRKSLVVVQFAISQCMIVGTLVVAYQVDFLKNKNLGFDKEAILSVPIPNQKNAGVLKKAIDGIASVEHTSLSSGAPAYANDFTSYNAPRQGMIKEEVTEIKLVDEKYLHLFHLALLAGTNLEKRTVAENDTVYDVVVNETLMHGLSAKSPQQTIGKEINFNGNYRGIIKGVVKDFQSGSRHTKIAPCILLYRPDNFNTACIKIKGADMRATVAAIDKAWSALYPGELFNYEFLDEHIAAFYSQEQKEYTAFKLFSVIAIAIGCLGLYGLVAFAAAQRSKEIGIRKVLGASVTDVILLFSKEFVTLIVIALLIAIPTSWYCMNHWLQNFAYQTSLGLNIFFITILSSFVIAGTTIFYQCVRLAFTNPVKSLRAE